MRIEPEQGQPGLAGKSLGQFSPAVAKDKLHIGQGGVPLAGLLVKLAGELDRVNPGKVPCSRSGGFTVTGAGFNKRSQRLLLGELQN
jgi:hypothetical protein